MMQILVWIGLYLIYVTKDSDIPKSAWKLFYFSTNINKTCLRQITSKIVSGKDYKKQKV